MREYLKYLWRSLLGFLLGILVALVCLQKCDRQKLPRPQPTEYDAKIDSVETKRDSVKDHLPDIRKMVVSIDSVKNHIGEATKKGAMDTGFVIDQLKARDILIELQDTLIKLDSTLIGTLYARDSVRVDTIYALRQEVKKQRLWKRFWRALVPVAFIAGKAL